MADTRPICVPCNSRMECESNSVWVAYASNGAQNGDLWKCPGCGHQIITRLAYEAVYAPPASQTIVDSLRAEAIARC